MLAALVAAAVVATAPTPAAPTRWVTDTAGFMSEPARAALDAKLEAYERATGHQVVVWVGKSIGAADLADWAVRTFAAWKVGRKGLADGIAIFVLADDRKIDIEVGYGLEDKVPDAIASRIIREVMAPKLRTGDRDGAITAGADAVLASIEGKPWTGVAPTAEPPRKVSTGQWIIGGIALLGFLIFAVTHPRMEMLFLWTFMGRGGGGGFGGFGGGGGLGGGGFGGGSGSSGGGGARGGW